MSVINRIFIKFSLWMLLCALLFGVLAAFAFLFPENFNQWLPFQQMRPAHTSAALFWIITCAAGSICYFRNREQNKAQATGQFQSVFMVIWMLVIVAIFINYFFNQYGGREYWEFPSYLNIPLLVGWIVFTTTMLLSAKRNGTAYEWMWLTGAIFFLITFTEQNLWHLTWFRESYIREVTVQWKANGSMVGAWNQMINGLSLFLIIKISGNKELAYSKTSFFLFFLGLFNLMFNWGHHVYNLPNANWMRGVAYAVSMTEWVILIHLLRNFRNSLQQAKRLEYSVSFRFIAAAEIWICANLLLALLMSIPAINRYTHGTHITVAHAMGTTIGINTMILLAVTGYILKADAFSDASARLVRTMLRITNISLFVFWLSLIAAGIIKGYLITEHPEMPFAAVMQIVNPFILVVAISGSVMLLSLGTIAFIFLKKNKAKATEGFTEPSPVVNPEIKDEHSYSEI